MYTPLATRRVISSGVKGRPADGISALPFSVAYTVWYVEDRPGLAHVPVANEITLYPGTQEAGRVAPDG